MDLTFITMIDKLKRSEESPLQIVWPFDLMAIYIFMALLLFQETTLYYVLYMLRQYYLRVSLRIDCVLTH